jgi:hypothetical protein
MMSQIDCRHWKLSTARHFQNGHHNTAKIQHCPISSKFDMWVDNDVPNWFPTLNNLWRSFKKWRPVEIFQSGINLGHHYLPTYQILMISDNRSPFSKWPPQYHTNSTLSNFKDISYVGRLWCPELIPDIEKFLPVSWKLFQKHVVHTQLESMFFFGYHWSTSLKTRYDYNLTIMESPKLATDNRFKRIGLPIPDGDWPLISINYTIYEL